MRECPVHGERTTLTDADMMTAKYHAALLAAVGAAHILASHDLDVLLNAISRADAAGALLDPTLYRDKAQAMHEDRTVFEAALPLWRLGRRLASPPREEKEI